MSLSNRARRRMIDKALYCKATGNLEQARELLRDVVTDDVEKVKFYLPKLKSKSFVSVPPRVEVTKSNQVNSYNKGDYYYSDLNCVFIRAK